MPLFETAVVPWLFVLMEKRFMRVLRAAVGTLLVLSIAASAAAQQPTVPTPTPAQPGAPPPTPGQPPSPAQPVPGQPAPGAAAPTPVAQPRTFTAPVGLLFNTVRADRVDDFEKAMGYLQAALASSTNERVREQAAGWRIFKATEAAPGGAVLYVFLLDPTVMGADYSLSRILYDAYPDQEKLREIWRLYTNSIVGGSLLNLTPVKPPAPGTTKPETPATTTPETPVVQKPEAGR
jgi:hypothetical protein